MELNKNFLKSQTKISWMFPSVVLSAIVMASLPHSLLQLYTGENPSFRSYAQANAFYLNLSEMRKSILFEAKKGRDEYRVWLTPDDNQSLASTQLYAYSLISFTPGIKDCNQVRWAIQGNNAKIMSFSTDNFTKQGFERYLEVCGAKIQEFKLVEDSKFFKIPYSVAKILPK